MRQVNLQANMTPHDLEVIVRQIDDLPKKAKRYVQRLEVLSGTKLALVSVGAGREETIKVKNPFASK